MTSYIPAEIDTRYEQRLAQMLPGIEAGYINREQPERSARWWAEGNPAYSGITKPVNGRQGDSFRANGSAYHPPESGAPEAGKGVTIGGALTLAMRMPDVEYVLVPIQRCPVGAVIEIAEAM